LFSNIVLPELVEKIKETYVLFLLNDYSCVTTSFDLWMSKGAHVTLGHPQIKTSYMLHLGSNWTPKHVILYLFKVAKTTGQVLAKNLIDLLDAYGLRNKIIAYVKDEGSNLNTLTSALNFVVKCETLGLEEKF
jgi:hypothetical protein